MKKRNLIIVAFAAAALTACGGSTTEKATETTVAAKEIETSVDEPVEDTADEEKSIAPFEEITVVDNGECAIKITEIVPDNMWGYTLKADMENKSTEKTYMYSVTDAFINGVHCNPGFATEITPGKKAKKEIHFLDSELQENGITEYTDIEISFRAYDTNDWSAEPVAEETVHIYPYGEDKATKFVRDPQESDTILADNDYVTVVVTGYEEDDIWGYTANLFLLNKTDCQVMFCVENASVNGYMADPFYASSVAADKCAFSSMSWSDTTLEENGITEIEEIEFTLRAYNSEDWSTDDFVNEVITLTP